MRNDLGSFAPSCIRYWTREAIRCFKSNFDCLKCKNYFLIESQPCQMKAAVLELYKVLGAPDEGNLKRDFTYGNRRIKPEKKADY